jgi:hypothetical protein
MIATVNFLLGFFFSASSAQFRPAPLISSASNLVLKKKLASRGGLLQSVPYWNIPMPGSRWSLLNGLPSSPLVVENMQLITAIVMTVLGILTLWSFFQAFNVYNKT